MHLAIPGRVGCTDTLSKINKLSRSFIYRLDNRRFGNNQLTSLPSWHLRESSVYKTPRTSEPPIPELAKGAHAHQRCLERKQWERREGASPGPPGPQVHGPSPRATARAASPPRAPHAPAPSSGARPTCDRAGKGLHLPNRVRAIVQALASCSPPPPVHALRPGPPEITASARRAHLGGAWWERRRAGRLQAGMPGAAARKSYVRVSVGRTGPGETR